jgi:hypothetical protein
MSLYRSPESYIQRELAKVPEKERAARRLELDLANILTGSTCGGEADRLAKLTIRNEPMALAVAMQEAAERYIASVRESKRGNP